MPRPVAVGARVSAGGPPAARAVPDRQHPSKACGGARLFQARTGDAGVRVPPRVAPPRPLRSVGIWAALPVVGV